MRIRFHPEATAELEHSADWYAERNPAASREFCVAVAVTIEKIARDPERFERIDDEHRVCGVQRFPFQVVFRCAKEVVVIVAIAHAKRRPDYWHGR